MATESPTTEQPTSNLLDKWKEWDNYNSLAIQSQREGLPSGTDLPRKEWVTLNRARSKVGRTRRNLERWGLSHQANASVETQTRPWNTSFVNVMGQHALILTWRNATKLPNIGYSTGVKRYDDELQDRHRATDYHAF